MGILINTGFDVGSSNPIDSRTVKNTTDERDALISDGLVYENLKVYCKDTQKEYRWTGTEWEIVGSSGGTGDIDLSDYYTKTEVDNDFLKKTDAASTYATKTELNEKANTSDIPTKVSELTNDSNYQTAKQVNSAVTTEIAKLEGKVNNLSHIKFATSRTKTNIDEILNIGTIGVYYQLYDSNSTGTKPTNADKSGIVKTEVWDNEGKYAVQEYDEMHTDNRKYMRYFNIDTWSAWKELATMDKVADIPNSDLTDINTKLTQLETKQINKTNIVDMNPTPVCYKITPKDTNSFSKILVVDLYGGCVLITGSTVTNYKSLKAVRLSNGCWESYSASNNVVNKIESVYYDGSYIYVNCLNYIKINFEGGFTNIEKIDSLPSNTTQIPILDLTQQTDLTDINDRLTQLENTTSGGNTNNDVYSTEEQAVGTWVGGQTLYRITLVPNKTITVTKTSEGSVVTEVLCNINTQYQVVKMEGIFKYNSGNISKICTIPCTTISDNMQINIIHSSTGDIVFQGKNVPVCNLTDIAVSIYYYKK